VVGQFLFPLRTPVSAAFVPLDLDRTARLFHRLGQPLGRIGRGLSILQIQAQLARVIEVTLAPLAEQALDVFGERDFDFLLLSTQLFDGVGLRIDRAGQLFDQGMAAGQVTRHRDLQRRILACCITHPNHRGTYRAIG